MQSRRRATARTGILILLSTALGALAAGSLPAALVDRCPPTGSLDVSKPAGTGNRAVVRWSVRHPEHLEDLIRIDERNTVVPAQDVLVEMRVAGISHRPGGQEGTVEVKARIGSDPWRQLFLGRTASLAPARPVCRQVVRAGTTIDISGRGHLQRYAWTPTRKTGEPSLNIRALTDGDAVPDYSPAFRNGDIEGHASAYVRDGTIVLNPREVIYLVELGQSDPSSGGFDMQDLLVVISFKDLPAPNSAPN